MLFTMLLLIPTRLLLTMPLLAALLLLGAL